MYFMPAIPIFEMSALAYHFGMRLVFSMPQFMSAIGNGGELVDK
jgi:hypothetical protein